MGDILLELSFSSTDWGNKKGKDDIMGKIKQNVCALLNSKGGKLKLTMTDGEGDGNNMMEADKIIRPVEQFFQNVIATSSVSKHLEISNQTFNEITWAVEGLESLCTLNYNLFLPTDTQVLLLSPVENDTARDILNVNRIVDVTETDRNIPTKFVLNCSIGIMESKTVQFKNLKTEKSKCNDLGSRIIHNKLTHYVSAFANNCGGRLYCGIRNDGIVEGEMVQEKDKDVIANKIIKCINKMKWPEHCGEPQRGRHGQWDISYEPVEDKGNPVKSTYVIVIFVAACPGGVFCSEPESYHIVKGKVEKMEFTEWRKKLLHPDEEAISSSMSRSDWSSRKLRKRRVDWSSKRRRKIFLELTTRLINFRNNGKNDAFSTLSELAMRRFPESETKLIVKAEEIVMAYKQHCFKKAESLLRDFSECLTSVKDSLIFEVRSLQLRSMIERGKGNYQESNKIAEDGLQITQFIAPGFTTIWFYIDAAMTATTLSNNEPDSQKCLELKKKARQYLDLATRDANMLDDFSEEVSDIQQKLSTYKAFVLLGCSVTGESARQRYDTTAAIDAAAKELAFVHETALTGKPLTHYRKVQYHLAQCDLLSLRKEGLRENFTQNVKRAFAHATKAITLARKHNFQDVIYYANKRRAHLTEDLVRNAMTPQSRKTALPTSFPFFYST